MNEWLKRYATANEQGADPLWRIDLVAGDREEIDAQLTYVGCNLADRLRRIGVKQNAALMSDPGALLDRLNCADLVIGMHDADKDRAWRDCHAQRPVALYRENRIAAQIHYQLMELHSIAHHEAVLERNLRVPR